MVTRYRINRCSTWMAISTFVTNNFIINRGQETLSSSTLQYTLALLKTNPPGSLSQSDHDCVIYNIFAGASRRGQRRNSDVRLLPLTNPGQFSSHIFHYFRVSEKISTQIVRLFWLFLPCSEHFQNHLLQA